VQLLYIFKKRTDDGGIVLTAASRIIINAYFVADDEIH
jgi:hypothetical protein